MKYLHPLYLGTFLGAFIFAAPVRAEVTADDDTCTVYSQLARSIMGARQAGVDMASVMKVTTDEVGRKLVIQAYEQPRYQTPANQRAAVDDFANDTYLACVKQVGVGK